MQYRVSGHFLNPKLLFLCIRPKKVIFIRQKKTCRELVKVSVYFVFCPKAQVGNTEFTSRKIFIYVLIIINYCYVHTVQYTRTFNN